MEKVETIHRTVNNFTLGEFKGDMEVNEEPSMTVPDMSYSIKEILEKFTNGVDLMVSRMPQYAENQELVDEFEREPDYFKPDFDLTDVPLNQNQEDIKPEYVKKREKRNEVKATEQKTDEEKKESEE